MRTRHKLFDVGLGTSHIRLMRKRDNLRAVTQRQGIEVNPSIVGRRIPLQMGTRTAAQFLPRNQVSVMLDFRDDDFIALFNLELPGAIIAQEVGDFIECLRGVFSECNFWFIGPDEVSDAFARILIGFCRFFRELIRAAVNGRIGVSEEVEFFAQHTFRSL